MWLKTLGPRQNGRHFPDAIFKWIFLNENVWISIKISFNFVPMDLIKNIPALGQIMAGCRRCDKPLSEPVKVSLLTQLCVTWPQWVRRCDFNQNPVPKPSYFITPFSVLKTHGINECLFDTFSVKWTYFNAFSYIICTYEHIWIQNDLWWKIYNII